MSPSRELMSSLDPRDFTAQAFSLREGELTHRAPTMWTHLVTAAGTGSTTLGHLKAM